MNSTTLLTAVSAVVDLLTTAQAFAVQAQRISMMIDAARLAGRDDLSDEDWAVIRAHHAAARAALAQALADRG